MFAKIAALLISTLLAAVLPAASPPAVEEGTRTADTGPEELARELIRVSGGGDMGKHVMNQMIAAFRTASPGIPEKFWAEFIASVDPRELEEMIVPIYVEHLTVEEMSAAIKFYGTPEGRSLVQKLPVIMQESMIVGQEWGERLGREVAQRIAEYEKARSGG